MNSQPLAQSLPPDPLAQLRDIHLPQSVSWWWPPAPGWWLLAMLLMLALGLAARWFWQRYKRGAYKRAGAVELEQLLVHWQASSDSAVFLQQLNALLKRTALHGFPGTDVAAMNGAVWTAFLDQHWSASSTDSTEQQFAGGPLEFGPYMASPHDVDVPALHRNSLRWLREHRGQRLD